MNQGWFRCSSCFTSLIIGMPHGLPKTNSSEEDKKRDEPRPVSYMYSFSHVIFVLASMYSRMLLTGYTTASQDSKELVNVGWPSVWVHVCTEWLTAELF
ncbi:hypothetical protein L7F22_027564 [Adiantum nelumboides]|nr:hypothetical protein [Adiantum nelumboides]